MDFVHFLRSLTLQGGVVHLGIPNGVLETGETYEIFSVLDGGIQVYIKTGFCGIKEGNFKIKD